MGIDLGQAIKINRLKSNMTQSELASGIISVSYLSKIENGTAEPPKEVIELLGEKLQINLLDSEELITAQTIIRWFHLLLQSNVDESIRLYNRIKNNLSSVIDKKMLSLIEIHKLYYNVLISDMEEAEKLIFSLQKSSKRFTETEMYYYFKFVGNYHYEKLEYKRALDNYQQAEKYTKSDLFHQSEEIHHLYYLISSAASKSRQPHLSLIYSIKALEYYQSNYDLKKCAECHILMGISYQRVKDSQNAKKSYNYAINIADKLGNIELLKLCYQNIGSLSSEAKEHTDAIIFYLKSYELRKEDIIPRRIVPVSSLMKEYYKLGDIINAKLWLELGLDLIKALPPTKSVHIYEFKVFQYLINGTTGTNTSFDIFMLHEVLPFLERKQLFYEKAFYLKHLALYYRDNRKYKLSSYYFEEAYQTLEAMSDI
ncbi:helix-turn-helix domain-containing protein [Ornithinibacillus scapharcae]|uniref:helix-turn-helix domain-containing protein n=1 Tax=Ornithinibacillus scapharcae TaxID=1147159 RepID=UPI000225AE1C|nr:helix-turn-helix transcriptional regulator [Ornithinibacillus scapharcae]